MNLNQLQVVGRIGQDARIVDHNGRQFLAFSLAVDDSYKDQHGTKIERTIWYDCISNTESHMKMAQWLTKGREVFVQGKPMIRLYTAGDGRSGASIRIEMRQVSLGHSPGDQAAAAPAPQPAPQPAAPGRASTQPQTTPFAYAESDDDLPF